MRIARLDLDPQRAAPILGAALDLTMPLRVTLLALALALSVPPSAAADAPVSDAVVTIVELDDVGGPFRLSAARPNPFTDATRLELTLDAPTELTVSVYDALGRRVSLLHEGELRAGTYSLRVEAGSLPPGLYLVRATDNRGSTATRSVSLTR